MLLVVCQLAMADLHSAYHYDVTDMSYSGSIRDRKVGDINQNSDSGPGKVAWLDRQSRIWAAGDEGRVYALDGEVRAEVRAIGGGRVLQGTDVFSCYNTGTSSAYDEIWVNAPAGQEVRLDYTIYDNWAGAESVKDMNPNNPEAWASYASAQGVLKLKHGSDPTIEVFRSAHGDGSGDDGKSSHDVWHGSVTLVGGERYSLDCRIDAFGTVLPNYVGSTTTFARHSLRLGLQARGGYGIGSQSGYNYGQVVPGARFETAPTTIVGGNASNLSMKISLTSSSTADQMVKVNSSNNATLQLPEFVTIPAGRRTAFVPITSSLVSVPTDITVNVYTAAGEETRTVTVLPAPVRSLVFSPPNLVGGRTVTSKATVTLSKAAGPDGLVVNLSSASSLVSFPATVTVPAGKNSVTFKISAPTAVATDTDITVTASTAGGSATSSFKVNSPTVASADLSVPSVVGGSADLVTFKVLLNGPAPAGGIMVSLSSSDSTVVTIPATAKISSGLWSTTVKLKHRHPAAPTSVTLTATLGGSISKTLTVN
jgi:hypothetical protein